MWSVSRRPILPEPRRGAIALHCRNGVVSEALHEHMSIHTWLLR